MARVRTATRTVSNSGQRRTLVCVASTKAVGELPTESLVEFDGLFELVADPDIVKVQVQPFTFKLDVDGIEREYTPDVRYVRRDGSIGYREFKHDLEKLTIDELRKLEVAADFIRSQGYEFMVRAATDIRHGFRIRNLKLLYRYMEWPVSQSLRMRLDELLAAGPQPLHELHRHCGPDAIGSIYRLMWDRWLQVDLDSELLSRVALVRRSTT